MTKLPPLDRCFVCSRTGDPVPLYLRGDIICHKCLMQLVATSPDYVVLIAVTANPAYYQESEDRSHG